MIKQDLFHTQREEWLQKARHTAEKLAIEHGSVDIEDVLALCPRPRFLHKNVTGHVFKAPVFRTVGIRKSRRPISNGRLICIWAVREEFYPKRMLYAGEAFIKEYGDSY